MNRLSSQLLRALAMLLFMAGSTTHTLHAEKISLEDSILAIGNRGLKLSDSVYAFPKSDSIPNKILIDELALAYSSKPKNRVEFTIIKNNTDTISGPAQVKGGFVKNELLPVRLYLEKGNTYTFKHGQMTWELSLKVPQTQPMASTASDVSSDQENDSPDFINSIPRWVDIAAIAVLFFALIAMVFITTRSKKLKKQPEPESPQQPETGGGTSEGNEKEIREGRPKIVPIYPESIISEGLLSPADYNKIKESLGLNNDCDLNDILSAINDLKNRPDHKPVLDTPTTPKTSEKEIRNKYADKLIEKVQNNKDLKVLVKKAQNNATSSDADSEVVLDKLINQLIYTCTSKTSAEPNSSSFNLHEWKKGLTKSDTRNTLKDWVIEKIRDNGYSGLSTIMQYDEVFTTIADALKQANNNAEPTDSDKESNLTEAQKKTLLSQLIADLNNKLSDTSFSPDMEINDFLEMIARKIQQPSTIEEAQNTLTQQLLSDVNSVLGSNLNHINRQSILEAYQEAVLKLFNSKLTGFDVSDYEDAIKKLTTEHKKVSDLDLISDDIKESIHSIDPDSGTVVSEDDDCSTLWERYKKLSTVKTNELSDSINKMKKEICDLREKNERILSESKQMQNTLHEGAKQIQDSWRTILTACSDSDEEQCTELENRLMQNLQHTVSQLCAFSIGENTEPQDARLQIQKKLEEVLTSPDSPFNTIGCYYAYSRLPFMTDTSREYGVSFIRKNIQHLYKSIATLYTRFGISLHIPDLFVAGVNEGEFENVTGRNHSELDNLCANARNHVDKIDSQNRPSDILVDVITIGYTIDGKEVRKSQVITF